MSKYKNWDIVFDYARDCISGKRIANKYRIKACERFLEDCESGRYDFDPKDAEFVIRIIEIPYVTSRERTKREHL